MFLVTNGIGGLHQHTCPWWAWVAAALAVAYTLASIVYLVGSRAMGTPFNDSLTDEQRRLKSASSKKRGALFLVSFAVSLLLFVLIMKFWL